MNESGLTARAMEIAAEALERTPPERAAFLDEACGMDAVLRGEVDSLLRFERPARGFIARSAVEAYPQAVLASPNVARTGSLQPGRALGRFQIISLLGEGGMGEVYLAEDPELGRRVAIKLVKWGSGSEVLLRHFEQEKRILAGLNDPHIARLYGAAVADDGRPYLIMEHVEGERLDAYCRDHRLPLADRLVLFRKVCAAVAYAHQRLVIHRDLKPANIRVTPQGEPKLLDFGIAKLLEPDGAAPANQTMTLYGVMTPEYASPEQIRGEPITTASDVYSLGVILYEILTDQRPYPAIGSRPDEVARVICEQNPLRPSTRVQRATPEYPGVESPDRLRRLLAGDLDNIVAKAMHKEPARRYASVAQFAEDIRRHGEGLPVFARPDTLGYRAGKFARRNKVAVAAGVLVVLSLIVGLATTAWQTRVARRERDSARTSLRQAERLDGFLQNLLRSADPAKMGKDVKIAQMLDAAGESLDQDLADEPEVLAKAHESMAYVYGRLGQLEPSERHIRAALEIRRRLHGEDDPATMRAELWMAGALGNARKYLEAESYARQALAARRRQSPPDVYWTARTADVLGAILGQTGRPAEAETLLEQALATMRITRGDDSPDAINITYDLAWTKLSEGQLEAAEAGLRQVIERYDRRSPHGLEALPAQVQLAICLMEQRRTQEARVWVDRAEADTSRLLGSDGVSYAMVRLTRACLDFVEGKYPLAIEEARAPLETIVSGCPNDDLSLVEARCVLGLALLRTGRASEGEECLRLAYARAKEVPDAALDLLLGNPATALGECLLVQARYEEAEPLLLEGCNHLKARFGEQSTAALRAGDQLRELYRMWRKPPTASQD